MTTTTIKANTATGRPNEVTVDQNGQEMIELDDDSSNDCQIDDDEIMAAMENNSPTAQR